MPLTTITDRQIQQLNQQGFFILENVFTAEEMATLALHIEEHQRRHEEELKKAQEAGESGVSRAGEISFTMFLAEKDAAIREFVTRPEFVAIATKLLGPDTELYWNQSVFKHPQGHAEFPWHQDDAYTPVTPSPYLTLWLALTDATPENGCISVLPKSHLNGLVPHQNTPIGWSCHTNDDPDQGVYVPVKCGSMAVFWSTTFHKSGVNSSNGMRKAYVIQYSKTGMQKIETGEVVKNDIILTRNGQAVTQPSATAVA